MEEIDWSKVKLPTAPQMKTAFETQEGTKNALTAVEISLENIQLHNQELFPILPVKSGRL